MTASVLVSQRYVPGDIVVGKYLLTEMLGQGGMGEVWEALNISLHAPVAIKVIKGELADDVSRKRLLFEARVAAKLAHPAIIKIFDVGETERAEPYVVMERLRGETLRDVLDDGRRNIVFAVQTLLPILDALRLAHSEGLVHRDVKPDNIFLSSTGAGTTQPKLLDFGVVKGAEYDRQLTVTGTVVGSPPYMSPEQARGEPEIDHHADLWAVNVMLHEFATGDLPFDADNYNALLRCIVEEEAPRLPDGDVALETLAPIIAKGLAKNKNERWQSAEELATALAEWLISQGVTDDATGSRLTGRWPALPRFNTPRVSRTASRASYVALASPPERRSGEVQTLSENPIVAPARVLSRRNAWALGGMLALIAAVALVATASPRVRETALPAFSQSRLIPLLSLAKTWKLQIDFPTPLSSLVHSRSAADAASRPESSSSPSKEKRVSAPRAPKPKRRAPKNLGEDLGLKDPY